MKRVLILAVDAALVILCCFLASGVIKDVIVAVLAPGSAEASLPPASQTQPPVTDAKGVVGGGSGLA